MVLLLDAISPVLFRLDQTLPHAIIPTTTDFPQIITSKKNNPTDAAKPTQYGDLLCVNQLSMSSDSSSLIACPTEPYNEAMPHPAYKAILTPNCPNGVWSFEMRCRPRRHRYSPQFEAGCGDPRHPTYKTLLNNSESTCIPSHQDRQWPPMMSDHFAVDGVNYEFPATLVIHPRLPCSLRMLPLIMPSHCT